MEVQLLVMRKNGIINGGNMAIIVHTNKSELEYDIWTLVRAFYPQNEVLVKNDKIAGILKNICYFFCFSKQKVYFCIYKIKLLP